MKKLNLLFCACMMALAVHAQDKFNVNGIYYLTTGGSTCEVTYKSMDGEGYPSSDYTGAITIPSTVTYGGVTYAVTCIGYGAFYECDGLTSIILPSSVTRIDNNAKNRFCVNLVARITDSFVL